MTTLLQQHWGGKKIATRGRLIDASKLPGFAAVTAEEGCEERSGELNEKIREKTVGLITYQLHDNQCEIVTLNSLREGIGVGSALLDAVLGIARNHHLHRVWLTTTNDNTDAMNFYEKRGFGRAAIHTNAIEAARKLKPQIPLVGLHGIPIKDEIEYELLL